MHGKGNDNESYKEVRSRYIELRQKGIGVDRIREEMKIKKHHCEKFEEYYKTMASDPKNSFAKKQAFSNDEWEYGGKGLGKLPNFVVLCETLKVK